MKQYILPKQVNKELSDKARRKLLNWAFKRDYLTLQENYLTIGQMIEFLDEHNGFLNNHDVYWTLVDWGARVDKKKPLADILWQAIKEILVRKEGK